jgi:hypothetical protein
MGKKNEIDDEFLRREYVDKRRTCEDIGKEIGVSGVCINRHLRGLKIPIRNSREERIRIDKDFLQQEYIDNNRTLRSIADEIGCSQASVSIRIKKYGLQAGMRSLIGMRFGKLVVSDYIRGRGVVCRCDCGKIVIKEANSLTRPISGHKSCGCLIRRSGAECPSWSGYGLLSKKHFRSIVYGAKKRNIKFEITIEYIWQLYEHQNGLCAISGVPISFGARSSDKNSASLDRIDSSLGYVEGNVQWVHKKINFMKGKDSDDEFIEWCRLVTNHQRKKNRKKNG